MPRGRPRREELEGFRAAVELRFARSPQRMDPRLQALLTSANEAFQGKSYSEAERRYREVADALDGDDVETELTEIPRGLVDYTPIGERGAPPSREEDPLANRLLLVQRLLQVRLRTDRTLEPWLRRLQDAEAALRSGDRATARQICDEVHDAVDPAGSVRPPSHRFNKD